VVARLTCLWLLLLPTLAPAQPPADNPLPPGAVARFGVPLLRPVGPSYCRAVLAVSPDGNTLATEHGLNGIQLWDAHVDGPQRIIPVPDTWLSAVSFSPDGKRLAFAGKTERPEVVWNGVIDLATGQIVWKAPGRTFVQFLPDGRLLAASVQHLPHFGLLASSLQPVLLDPATGKVLREFGGGDGWLVLSVAPASGGTRLATLRQFTGPRAADGKLQLTVWDVASGKAVFQHTERYPPAWGRPDLARLSPSASLALAPDGKTLALADQGVTFLDATTGKHLRHLAGGKDTDYLRAVFAPDGKVLAFVESVFDIEKAKKGVEMVWPALSVCLVDVASGKEQGRYPAKFSGINPPVTFSPDGRWLMAVAGGCAVRCWNVTPSALDRAREGHTSPVLNLQFARAGATLISCDARGARWWDLAGRKQTATLDLESASDIDIAADGQLLAVIPQWIGNRLRVVDAKGKPRFEVEVSSNALCLSPDGKHLVWADTSSNLHLLDAVTGKELRQWRDPGGIPNLVRFSTDGKMLLSAYHLCLTPSPRWAESVRLRDISTGEQLRVWDLDDERRSSVLSAAFSADGRTVVTGNSQGVLILLDVASGQVVWSRKASPKQIRAVAFAPDGRSVAAAGDDWVVRWWEVATGQERCRFVGHTAPVRALAFSPNGKALASAGDDTAVLVWGLREPAAAKRPVKELWADLLGDADKFPAAVAGLRAQPHAALKLLRQEVRPIPAVPAQRISERIADLDSPKFAVRAAANRDLESWLDEAEPHLRRVLAGDPSLELQRRVEALLAKLDAARLHPSAAEVRALRMLELLEHLGTPEARALLQELAAGAPEARRTRSARAALGRLNG
jgi:WD40 repeat protein